MAAFCPVPILAHRCNQLVGPHGDSFVHEGLPSALGGDHGCSRHSVSYFFQFWRGRAEGGVGGEGSWLINTLENFKHDKFGLSSPLRLGSTLLIPERDPWQLWPM